MADSLATTLLTILASGVASAIVTYRLNRNKEHTFFMRKKAEELYLATDEFGKQLGIHMVTLLSVVDGQIDYNQFLDIQNATPPKKLNGGAETMEMLGRIYFPEIKPKLEELLAHRDSFSELRNVHKVAYKDGYGDDEKFGLLFRSEIRRVDQATKALQDAIVQAARRHAEDRWTIPFLHHRSLTRKVERHAETLHSPSKS